MSKINMTRVIIGGLLTGLVLNIGEFVLNETILGAEWEAAMASLNREALGFAGMGAYALIMFIMGVAIIWLYATLRPKFGAGPKTAIITGLAVWFFVWLLGFGGTMVQDLYPGKIVLTSLIWGFFEVPISALVGAWLYKDPEAAANA
jgi:hypothetical protein